MTFLRQEQNCLKCQEKFEWQPDYDFKDVSCPKCGALYKVMYDEVYEEDFNEEYQYFWLELKTEP